MIQHDSTSPPFSMAAISADAPRLQPDSARVVPAKRPSTTPLCAQLAARRLSNRRNCVRRIMRRC